MRRQFCNQNLRIHEICSLWVCNECDSYICCTTTRIHGNHMIEWTLKFIILYKSIISYSSTAAITRQYTMWSDVVISIAIQNQPAYFLCCSDFVLNTEHLGRCWFVLWCSTVSRREKNFALLLFSAHLKVFEVTDPLQNDPDKVHDRCSTRNKTTRRIYHIFHSMIYAEIHQTQSIIHINRSGKVQKVLILLVAMSASSHILIEVLLIRCYLHWYTVMATYIIETSRTLSMVKIQADVIWIISKVLPCWLM